MSSSYNYINVHAANALGKHPRWKADLTGALHRAGSYKSDLQHCTEHIYGYIKAFKYNVTQ